MLRSEPAAREGRAPQSWCVALAGGDGLRLAGYVERRFGEPRPKQYCAFFGERSMFQHTLERAAQIASPERALAVVGSSHVRWASPQLAATAATTLIVQPANRDTAPGLLLPLATIKRRDPDAIVAVLPSDHFIRPDDAFVDQIRAGLRVAASWRDRLVLFGIEPDGVEPEYGYVVPDTAVLSRDVRDLRTVGRFVEKPCPAVAQAAIRSGALWNTFVMVGHVDAFLGAARACLPEVTARFDRLIDAIDTPEEPAVRRAIYEDMPAVSWSRAVLERVVDRCLLARLDGVEWSDWGRAERIEATIARLDVPAPSARAELVVT